MALMQGITGSASPGRAVALAVAGGALLTISDTGLKWLSEQLAPGQIMVIRGIVASTTVIIATALMQGVQALKPRDWRLHLIRGVLAAAATFTFLLGIPTVPLATAIAILFASPILMTALAPLFIGESVGWRRWGAVIIGFAGVLIIVRPGADGIEWAALMILAAALFEAVRDLVTRGATGRESTQSMLLTTLIILSFCGFAVPPYDWPDMTGDAWLIVIMASLIWTGANFLLIEAFRFGEAALLAPFKYVNLGFATAMGFLVWGTLPDAYTWFGGGIIVAAGLYIFHREVLRQAPVKVADPLHEGAEPDEGAGESAEDLDQK